MSSSPPEKKRKSNNGTAAAESSWRATCIEKFDLLPVPNAWKKSVAVGSEDAWKRYYRYRTQKEKDDALHQSGGGEYDSDGNSIDDECNWEKDAIQSIVWGWADPDFNGMGRLTKLTADGCPWRWTPQKPKVAWEDEKKPRSVDYYSHVWSPYAMPRAIKLSHYWCGRLRWDSYDLSMDWNYTLLDFEDGVDDSECQELCSNNDDVIKTSRLNKTTVNKLRKFLYGATSKASKEATCSDRDFLLLLFGSMGSADEDLMEDQNECSLGYAWCPWKDEAMKRRLFEAKAPANDDPNGEPPKELQRYSPRWCSWLRYRILEVTGTLGPISKHYQPPPAKSKKISGYDDSDSDGSDDYGLGCSYLDGGDY